MDAPTLNLITLPPVACAVDIESATATPRSPVSVAVTMRKHTLIQDKLVASGGKDEGPMASEFLLASLLACQHSTSVKVAAKRKATWKVRELHGDMMFDDAGDISSIKVRFEVESDAEDAAVHTILRLTEKSCTISRVLKIPVEVVFRRVGQAAHRPV